MDRFRENFRSRIIPSDHRTIVTNFKLRLKRARRIPSPFSLFDFSRLADPEISNLFEQTLSQRLSDAPADAEDPSGFGTLKNAIHEVAAQLLRKERPLPTSPVRNHPSIAAGRSASAILRDPSSQIVPELYRQVLEEQLTALCNEIEGAFEGNKTGIAYKQIAGIAGTSWRSRLGLSGTPSEVKRTWVDHYTHLFRQEDSTPQATGASAPVQDPRTSAGRYGEDSMQIPRSPVPRRGDGDRSSVAAPKALRSRRSLDAGSPVSVNPRGLAFDRSLGRSEAPISVVAVVDAVANNPSSSLPFSEVELDLALQTSRNSSCPGLDALPYTVLKIPLVKSYILSTCNYTLASGVAPPLWLNSAIIPLHKKGNFNDPSNYRGIALTSTAAKIFNKMLLHRLRSLIDHKLRPSQNGFRPHRSCTQHILALRRIIENCTINKRHSVLITFIAARLPKSPTQTTRRRQGCWLLTAPRLNYL